MQNDGILLLSGGTKITGTLFGAKKDFTIGEICFNTGMTGYQETITDPSYNGRIITFTFPHIGNVGCNEHDIENNSHGLKLAALGIITQEKPTEPSNYRSTESLESFMISHGVCGIYGIDTRFLTQKIRTGTASNVMITTPNEIDSKLKILQNAKSMDGMELSSNASCAKPYKFCDGNKRVAVIDYGTKTNILRILKDDGLEVHVFPYNTTFDEIIAIKPSGVLLSNGPGDPRETLKHTGKTIESIIKNNIPLFGICLGHQLLSLVSGMKVIKLPQGHRGVNHPVFNGKTVEITAQNHGFACIDEQKPDCVEITHRSLFDGIIEGIALKNFDGKAVKYAKSVQYHPESSAGPNDSKYLFDEFISSLI